MRRLAILALALVLIPAICYGQQITPDKTQRGSEEISEYYKPEDVKIAMIVIAIAVISIFLYLGRDIILRRKSEYEKKEYQSKKDRDYEKYHSEWTGYDEDFFGAKKSKEAKEFQKMIHDSALPNYYAVLETTIDATPEEIKAKFRRLAKENHPDKSKDEKSTEKFAEITKAYEVLSNEETRKEYDKYYKASFGG
ncbi:MAG: J domain-containing protein [Nitrososphaeria archaeon]|nr:J domain-containing protein [Nitrososphaeria archaeon]